ncbi:MAG: hypothetical protein ACLRFL_03680 [Clostridia bacterium]
MTKLKSKKMTKSTLALIIMAVAMVAMLAFGGTYAYFTATATTLTSEGLKTGYIKLTTDAEIANTFKTTVLPGDEMLDADVTYTVDTTDTQGNYVFVKVALSSTVTEVQTELAKIDLSTLNLGTGWKASSTAGVYYQENAVMDNGTAVIESSALVLPTTVTDNWDQGTPANSAGNLMDQPFTLTIQAKSIQVSNQPAQTTAASLSTTIFG